MIAELRIQGLGVIDGAEIEPGPGLTCVTGETGAGKTMLLTAIDLLRGAKCPASLISADRVRVEAVLGTNREISAQVTDLGGEASEGEVIVARVVPREGRARAFVGGASVPASQLASITGEAVVVHGQAEQLRLRSAARQRLLLDTFGGESLAEAKQQYATTFEQLTEARSALNALKVKREAIAAEAEQLREGLAAIEAVDPQPGEDEPLRSEAERLTNAEDLLTAAEVARVALSGDNDDGDAATLLAHASRSLTAGARFDETLTDLAVRADEIATLIGELAADVASYAADLEADPARLQWIQDRRADIARIARRFGGSLGAVHEWAESAEARLAEFDDVVGAENLAADVARLEKLASSFATALSQERGRAAARLSAEVTGELAGLAMPDAHFEVLVERQESPAGSAQGDGPTSVVLDMGSRTVRATREGVDEVSFLLAAHKGAQPTALGVSASGGELSRVMLALEVVLAGQAAGTSTAADVAGRGDSDLPTMIFDEIDAGVGGKAAVEIGRRLARLADHTQVIVVTHLPQVAAFADTHIRVRKDSDGVVTTASVEVVEGADRRQEIARMLAGQDDSDHALAHADELLALAGR